MIRTRADDSVMDFVDEKPYMIRRSRGFAPLPVMIGSNETYDGNTAEGLKGHVLAIGGELKNTFALAKDSLIYPSAYIGDMADIRSVDALTESVDRMTEMLEIEPSLIVCDKHPKYNTSAVAEELGVVFAVLMALVCVSTFLMIMREGYFLKDRYYRLVVCGIGVAYIFQTFLTIGGGAKFIPLTGVTLPLVSYGGTSVFVTIIMMMIAEGVCMIRTDERFKAMERRRQQSGAKES
jgi:hypothetical protein